jgi:uncharacterized metal-binding protein
MVDLPKKKVGIVACSGEELAEGTVSRLAALKVLEVLRPKETVTICLPLFLAGGEGDRAFARFYPTIAVDGCELRCAARGTEMYSGKPAASVVVTEVVKKAGIEAPQGYRRLNDAGLMTVDATAERVADLVDTLLEKRWNRRRGEFVEDISDKDGDREKTDDAKEGQSACACGSGIPIQKINIKGKIITLIGLPLILEQMKEAGKPLDEKTASEILETVKIYNQIPPGEEADYSQALLEEYSNYIKGSKL